MWLLWCLAVVGRWIVWLSCERGNVVLLVSCLVWVDGLIWDLSMSLSFFGGVAVVALVFVVWLLDFPRHVPVVSWLSVAVCGCVSSSCFISFVFFSLGRFALGFLPIPEVLVRHVVPVNRLSCRLH